MPFKNRLTNTTWWPRPWAGPPHYLPRRHIIMETIAEASAERREASQGYGRRQESA